MNTKDGIIGTEAISDDALDRLFRTARTFSYWQDRPVGDDTLHRLYDLMKWGPTSVNGCPRSHPVPAHSRGKAELVPALMGKANVEKVLAAPVTAIVGYDLHFYDQMSKLYPQAAGFRDVFAASPELAEANRPPQLQLARSVLDRGGARPGTGLRPQCPVLTTAAVDREFFPGTRRPVEFPVQPRVRRRFTAATRAILV